MKLGWFGKIWDKDVHNLGWKKKRVVNNDLVYVK